MVGSLHSDGTVPAYDCFVSDTIFIKQMVIPSHNVIRHFNNLKYFDQNVIEHAWTVNVVILELKTLKILP